MKAFGNPLDERYAEDSEFRALVPADSPSERAEEKGETSMNRTIEQLAADQDGLADEVARLRICVSMLREACSLALAWVENMRIVEGGGRARLRDALRLALGSTDPAKPTVQP